MEKQPHALQHPDTLRKSVQRPPTLGKNEQQIRRVHGKQQQRRLRQPAQRNPQVQPPERTEYNKRQSWFRLKFIKFVYFRFHS